MKRKMFDYPTDNEPPFKKFKTYDYSYLEHQIEILRSEINNLKNLINININPFNNVNNFDDNKPCSYIS
jgi:hypothetical protein